MGVRGGSWRYECCAICSVWGWGLDYGAKQYQRHGTLDFASRQQGLSIILIFNFFGWLILTDHTSRLKSNTGEQGGVCPDYRLRDQVDRGSIGLSHDFRPLDYQFLALNTPQKTNAIRCD